MSFLSRLFKSNAPAAPTLEERIAGLANLSPQELQNTLTSDTPEALRAAAIALMPYSETLKTLALNEDNAIISRAAQVRLGQLFDQGGLAMSTLIAGATTTEQRLSLTQFSSQASLEVIDQIDDSQALVELACTATVANVRQAAANKVLDHQQLQLLLKNSKGKDKAVYKLVKTKLDAHKTEQAQSAATEAAASDLCATAERLNHQNQSSTQAEEIEQLHRRWASLNQQADVASATQDRFNQAIAAYEQRIAEEQAAAIAERNAANEQAALIAQQQDEQQQQQAKALKLQHEQQQALLNETLAAVQEPQAQVLSLLCDIYNSETFNAQTTTGFETALRLTRNLIDELSSDAQQLSAVKQFNASHKDALTTLQLCTELEQNSSSIEALCAELCNTEAQSSTKEQVAKQLGNIARAAKHLDAEHLPAVIVRANAALDEYKSQQKAAKQKQDGLRRQLSDLLRRGLHAIEDKNLRRVSGITRDVEKLVPQLQPLPNGMANKVADLEEGLHKLRDWHSFATEPKKQELLSKMEALIGNSLHPTDLASRVQHLQEEWKELSRGSKNQDEELWQAFQTAANKAYEPCHEHFGDQAKLREENLAKRRTLLEQLKDYIDSNSWDSSEWQDEQCKAVEQLRQLAREEWRRYSPVARNVNQELQQTFEQYLDHISQSIDAFFERGKNAKQQLIKQAEQIANGDNNRATDGIKRLQAQWKSAGRCNRKDEKNLWNDFRTHCDTVFARRDQESAAKKVEHDANQAAVEPVLAALDELLQLSGQAYLDAASSIRDLSDQYYAIGELPRATRAKVSARFRQLQSDLKDKTSSERQHLKDLAWENIFTASDCVREFEWQTLDKDSAQAALDKASESANGKTKSALQAIEKRFAQPATVEQQADNTQALKTLCIRAEILTGQETPEEYKAQRMEYQMAQLKQGLGQADKDSMDAYTQQWLETGAAEQSSYDALWQRFNLCRQAS